MGQKVLVHFDTRKIVAYSLISGVLTSILEYSADFSVTEVGESMFDVIDQFMYCLGQSIDNWSNETIRLYATGVFQCLDEADQMALVNHVFVDYALYFNIVPYDLEQFYLNNSMAYNGAANIIQGIVIQEFRQVVICGSFQQYLHRFEDVIAHMNQHHISVLSPWTTKVRPETLGTDFILLEGQDDLKNERDTWRHKYEHMDKFRRSDAIIVCDPNGDVGRGTIFELGFIIALRKRIIFLEKPEGLTIHFPFEVGLNF